MRSPRLCAFVLCLAVFPLPAGAETPMSNSCVKGEQGAVRQTEDPMSPPCVAFFDGDNGGRTWRGVEADEIRIVMYFDVGTYEGEQTPPGGTVITVNPEEGPCTSTSGDGCDHVLIRATRSYAAYFNDRFQTYQRTGRYYAFFSAADSASERRADAAIISAALDPFIVIDQAFRGGHNDAFADALGLRSIVVTASPAFAGYSLTGGGYLFSFWPDVDDRAQLYASYICGKVAPYPVRHMGDPPGSAPEVGEARRLGLYHRDDVFAGLVKGHLRQCGATWVAEVNASSSLPSLPLEQTEAVTRFQLADVTTVLWLGEQDQAFSHAAAEAGYYPEIVLAGDGTIDTAAAARLEEQRVWQNAWAVHDKLRVLDPNDTIASRAYLEGGGLATDAAFASRFYRAHFFPFVLFQISGPNLNPQRMHQGLAAIPGHQSSNPDRASCSAGADDASCINDAMEIWWDPQGTATGTSEAGCMRMVSDGARFRAQDWSGPETVFDDPDDSCTAYQHFPRPPFQGILDDLLDLLP